MNICQLCGSDNIIIEEREFLLEKKEYSVKVKSEGTWCLNCGEGFYSSEQAKNIEEQVKEAKLKYINNLDS
jgi:YgiT-type zinc finger domain-containing protein